MRLRCFLLLIILAPGIARAHDAPFALTSIEWNASVNSLEIIHRLHAHQALELAATSGDDDVVGPRSLAFIGLHVQQRFAVMDEAGPIDLEFVGAELEGDYVLVYQEAVRPAPPAALRIRNDILVDASPAQVNQVNVDIGQGRYTLVFNEDRRGRFLDAAQIN